MSNVVITPEATLSYPALFEPKAGPSGGPLKYSCALVFPAGSDLDALRAAAREAAIEKWGPKWEDMYRTKKLRMPFRADAEDKGYPEGSIFMNVRSDKKPGIVARHGIGGKPAPITDPAEMYAGCRVRASVNAFAYDTNGNKGVSFGLNNIQKLGEGERIDGRKNAQDEFDILEDSAADLL